MQQLLTHAEAAARLRISERTVYRLVTQGVLKSVQVSPGKSRIPASSVDSLTIHGTTRAPSRAAPGRNGYGPMRRTACGSELGLYAHQQAGERPCIWCAGALPGVREEALAAPELPPARHSASVVSAGNERHFITRDGILIGVRGEPPRQQAKRAVSCGRGIPIACIPVTTGVPRGLRALTDSGNAREIDATRARALHARAAGTAA